MALWDDVILLFKVADDDGEGQGHGQGAADGTECPHKLAQTAHRVNVSVTSKQSHKWMIEALSDVSTYPTVVMVMITQ